MDRLLSIEPREYLADLIRERGDTCLALSRLIGRNPTYISQFIQRGSPRILAAEERRILARHFGVPEVLFGAPEEPCPGPFKRMPRLHVRALAGSGAVPPPEQLRDSLGFTEHMLRHLVGSDIKGLSILTVSGDSMEPTLSDGDDILINRFDKASRLRDGIYVLHMGEGLHVKRVVCGPARERVKIISDNVAYPPWDEVDLKTILLIGRVVWVGRRVR